MSDTNPAWIAPSAELYGDVRLAHGTSVWPKAVMRSEAAYIEVGEFSNVQDHVMVHFGAGTPSIIGAYCSIAHHATVHGARIGDNCLIGINATVMDGAVIGDNSIIAGHCIVVEGTLIPPNSIVAGVPGKVVATRDNTISNKLNAWSYYRNAQAYARGEYRLWASEAHKLEMAEVSAQFIREHSV